MGCSYGDLKEPLPVASGKLLPAAGRTVLCIVEANCLSMDWLRATSGPPDIENCEWSFASASKALSVS